MRRIYCDVCGEEILDPSFDGLAGRFDVRSACPDIRDVCPSCSSYLKNLSVGQVVLDAWRGKAGLDGKQGRKKKKAAGKAGARKDAVRKDVTANRTAKRTGRPRKGKPAEGQDADGDAAASGPVGIPSGTQDRPDGPEAVVNQEPVGVPETVVPGSVTTEAQEAVSGSEAVRGDMSGAQTPVRESEAVRDDASGMRRTVGQDPAGAVGSVSVVQRDGYEDESVRAAGTGTDRSAGPEAVQAPVVPRAMSARQAGYGAQPVPSGSAQAQGAAERPAAKRGRKPKDVRIDPVASSSDAAVKGRIMRALMAYRSENGIGSLQALGEKAGVTSDELRRALSAERFEIGWWRKVEAGLRKMGRTVGEN